MPLPFQDRAEAGRELAVVLAAHGPLEDAFVLGLPRGGVPVAAEVAAHLGSPLDVVVVRKLGVPGQPELAMGAIASGGARVLNDDLVQHLGISPEAVDEVAERELTELARREREYRGNRPAARLDGHTVVLVDDGLATGASMRVAVEAVRGSNPARVVVAVPVGAPDTCQLLEHAADQVVCLYAPATFRAVGSYYTDFGQTTDEQVRRAMDQHAQR